MVEPVYPIQARDLEGVVHVVIVVGMDGRVLTASGSGLDPAHIEAAEKNTHVSHILVQTAEENARQWLWGPFPSDFQFPWYHEIRYVFRLQGKPTSTPWATTIVKTHLPDEIEIIGIRCCSGTSK